MADRTHLIVTGVARSGTTALAGLLNAHPAVCLGVERFKFRYLRLRDHSATLFEKERFFDFRPEDTNLLPRLRPHWAGVYESMAARWDAARVVGDKVPDLAPVLDDLLSAQPAARCIFITRNLRDVGLSWQARADRPRDSWPAGKGFAAACESWAAQHRTMRALLEGGRLRGRLLILDYDRMYHPGSGAAETILGFLGLPPDPGFADTFAGHAAFAARRGRRRLPACHHAAYRSVDMADARALRAEARRQMARGAAPAGAQA